MSLYINPLALDEMFVLWNVDGPKAREEGASGISGGWKGGRLDLDMDRDINTNTR